MAWIYAIGDTHPWLNTKDNPNVVNNTWMIYNYLQPLGYTIEAICGMVGNMRLESFVNPGQWELGKGGSLAYGWGLIQWTPGTDLINYVSGNWYDGDLQLQLVDDEITGVMSGRFIPTHAYPYTGSQFKSLTSIDTATKAYFYERERGTWVEDRLRFANETYEILTGTPPGPGPEPPGPTPGTDDEFLILMAETILLKTRGRGNM